MDFSQLLSIASKNASRQERLPNTAGTSERAPIVSSKVPQHGNNAQRVSSAKSVSKDAVSSYLEQKRQEIQDREKKFIEERRALLEKRLEKRRSAKQKEREESMQKSLETLRAEERSRQACKTASLNRVENPTVLKNNIKAQYGNGSAQPKTPAAPLDYQTLMKMAASKAQNGAKMSSDDLRVNNPNPSRSSIDDETVHLKKLKSAVPKSNVPKSSKHPVANATCGSNNRINSNPPSHSNVNSGTNGLKSKSKGIAAQLGISNSNVSKKEYTADPSRNGIRSGNHASDNVPRVKTKGIAAQCASQKPVRQLEDSNIRSAHHSSGSYHVGMSTGSRAPMLPSREPPVKKPPLPDRASVPLRGRGIAAQLGLNMAAKRKFEDQKYLEEEELEYDSELDDFIDDDEPEDIYGAGAGGGHSSADDVMAELRKITGYDPSRYRDEDVSDFELRRSMTASYSEILKEEKRSERIAMKEDAEEFKKEQDRVKKKAAKKSKLDPFL